jgi:hypothetical protein
MSIDVIKTLGLRALGILLVLAGAALLVPSLGATEKHSKSREQDAALHVQLAACLRANAPLEECRRTARRPSPLSP